MSIRFVVLLASLVMAEQVWAIEISSAVYSESAVRGEGGPPIIVIDEQPDSTGFAQTSMADAVSGILVTAGAVGYSGPSLTPQNRAYSFDFDLPDRIGDNITSINWGVQRYVFNAAGTVTLEGTLTFSQSGGPSGAGSNFPDIPTGRVTARLFAFQMQGDVIETQNCNVLSGVLRGLLRCMTRNGEPLPGPPGTGTAEFLGQLNANVVFFDIGESPVTNGVESASITITGNPGDVWFVGGALTAFAANGGSSESINTFTLDFDDPSLVQATGFLEDTAKPPPGGIEIDILPRRERNNIFPRFGRIPVAFLGSATVDALQIDPSTLRFGPNGTRPLPWALEGRDINRDGYADLTVIFRARRSGLRCGDATATVSGETYSGVKFAGIDSIITVGCRRRH